MLLYNFVLVLLACFIKPSLEQDNMSCLLCKPVIKDMLQFYKDTKSEQGLYEKLMAICEIQPVVQKKTCKSLIDINKDTVMYILNNTQGLTENHICGFVLRCDMGDASLDRFEWRLDLDLGKKPKSFDNVFRNIGPQDPLKIVQITDIHYDPSYKPYGNTECGDPMCCRSDQGEPANPKDAAGYWGDYRKCDLPWNTFQESLQHIKNTHKDIDYIYMTGDLVDHAVWDTSIEKNTNTMKMVLAEIKKVFPCTPVYPILGNHETHPVNVYAPTNITNEKISTNWLYKLVAEEWSTWLPSETKKTILKGGFYSAKVLPGFRVIALNSNVCYTLNWWLLYDCKDPYGQLSWLAETLLKAEKAAEKVHILSHIPSGDKWCQNTWSREFRKIIDRFQGTVMAQFNGHTHNDEAEIFYSLDEPTHPNNIAFIGGSLTPYEDRNPNYKVYSMDPESFSILDAETWIFYLTEANSKCNASTPQWRKLYCYSKDYGMESLSPMEFDKLAHKMASNKTLLMQYARHYVKDVKTAIPTKDEELKNLLCDMVISQREDETQCHKLTSKY